MASSVVAGGQDRYARRRAAAARGAQATAPGLPLDAIRLSLGIMTVLSVCRIHQVYGFIAAVRPGMTLSVLAVVAGFMNPSGFVGWSWRRLPIARIVIGIALATLGSIAFGISQGQSFWFFVDTFSKVLLACFLVMAAIRNTRDLRFFTWAYVVGAGILVWMAIFMFNMVAEHNGITRLSNLETWDANDIGVVLLVGLCLAMLLIRTSRLVGKLVAAVVALGIGVTMARSGSRGGFLGLLCVLLVYLVSQKGTSVARRLLMVATVFVALLFAAPTGYWKQMNTITSITQDYNWDAAQGRRELAKRGVGYMLSYPIFGVGVSNFGRAEATISPLAGEPGIRWSAPHNTYIQAGAEMGVPGLILFTALVIGCMIIPWRLRRHLPSTWAAGTDEQRFIYQATLHFPLAAIGFAIPAYFVSFAYSDPIYILAAMTAGLSTCATNAIRRDVIRTRGVVPGPARRDGKPPVRGRRGWRTVPNSHRAPAQANTAATQVAPTFRST